MAPAWMERQQAGSVPKEPGLSGGQYLGTRVTHFDGELIEMELAIRGHIEESDCKSEIRTVEKLDKGKATPR